MTNDTDLEMSFSEALEKLKQGKKVARTGWNGSGLHVAAQFPDAGSMNTLPYLYIKYPEDHKKYPSARCPWLASQTDIMEEDWFVVE